MFVLYTLFVTYFVTSSVFMFEAAIRVKSICDKIVIENN